MKRLLLNGSPRGLNSNSRLILSWITGGMREAGVKEELPILDLADVSGLSAQLEAFLSADEVLLAFPLYTDSMPGIVKNFIDALAPIDPSRLKGKRLAFVVQSGFSESIHSEAVAFYMARLCARLGFTHAGTIIKGGVEGIRIMPEKATERLRLNFTEAGRQLAAEGAFSPSLAEAMAKRRTMTPFGILAFRVLALTGITNFYWNMMLKKHKAFDRRFDAPYGQAYKAGS